MAFSRRTFLTVGILCVVVCSEFAAASEATLLVKLHQKNVGLGVNVLNDSNLEVVEALVPEIGLYLVKVKDGNADFALKKMRRANSIVYAQKDHEVTRRSTVLPNDADFNRQWSMQNVEGKGDIRSTEAWAIGTGGKDRDGNDIVVAVVDGGMDIKHSDLVKNLWVNKGEIADNQIDDDGNGYVDDVNGWNAFNKSGKIPSDSHGTHVAGIIGAEGNNGLRVAGINWNIKVMPVAAASNKTSVISIGYGYVIRQKKLWLETKGEKGANIVATNSSFGVDYADCTKGEYPVWNDLYNEMGKLGILSAAATANNNVDVDARGDVPTGCGSEYIISVTNTDQNDRKVSYAGYGKTTIDIGAPGLDIVSTVPGDSVSPMTGTSMATPHVAGAVGLLHSVAGPNLQERVRQDPAAASLEIKRILMDTVDKKATLETQTVSGGRMNLGAATRVAAEISDR